ncbi:transcriptional regulator domain-containing protein [Paracoccus methylovorus]|uniref:transcriptional regulator domain-containing protein n=1 Tax=Paracoccus methylovorus TaxID=2812658 RepID=UPI0038990FF0
MRPDTSRWRADSTYDAIDHAGVDHLAWECLRRNGDYQKDYAALRRAGDLGQPLPEPLERRWGLRFPGPAAPCRH